MTDRSATNKSPITQQSKFTGRALHGANESQKVLSQVQPTFNYQFFQPPQVGFVHPHAKNSKIVLAEMVFNEEKNIFEAV